MQEWKSQEWKTEEKDTQCMRVVSGNISTLSGCPLSFFQRSRLTHMSLQVGYPSSHPMNKVKETRATRSTDSLSVEGLLCESVVRVCMFSFHFPYFGCCYVVCTR